jgi:CRISPR-associated protein Cmr3
MNIWILEPRDPLIVRDGRPFGPDPGARATSLPFPFPSTIAGGIRARAGLNDQGAFKYTKNDEAELKRLKQLRVRGPLLVRLTENSGDITPDNWLVPAPGDALLLPPKKKKANEEVVLIQQLEPLVLPQGAQTDIDAQELAFVGQPVQDEQSKPLKRAPAYWYWNIFETWLLNPSALAGQEKLLFQLGLPGLVREQRLHVSIDADKEIAKDGMLFETSGLEFTVPGLGEKHLSEAQRLALAVAVDDDNDYKIHAGLTSFGGERRIVTWRKSSAKLPPCLEDIVKQIVNQRHCRIILLTPACFEQGYSPTWLHIEAAKYGIQADLKAIAVQRPQVVSGWDFALNEPKPSRRLAPAGTVMFLSLKGSEEAMGTWIRDMWMQCISDNPQDRTDGFGLAVLGTWSGQLITL